MPDADDALDPGPLISVQQAALRHGERVEVVRLLADAGALTGVLTAVRRGEQCYLAEAELSALSGRDPGSLLVGARGLWCYLSAAPFAGRRREASVGLLPLRVHRGRAGRAVMVRASYVVPWLIEHAQGSVAPMPTAGAVAALLAGFTVRRMVTALDEGVQGTWVGVELPGWLSDAVDAVDAEDPWAVQQ